MDSMLQFDTSSGLMVPRPGFAQHGSRSHYSINALGFRGEPFAVKKEPGTIRIACLGASTTFCAEVSSNDKTWPHLLQERLRAEYGDHIEVINAGVPGFTISESHKNLIHRVLPLEPDLVIFYEANNEIAKNTRQLAIDTGILQSAERQRSGVIAFLSKYSMLIDLAHKNLRIAAGGSGEKLQTIPPEIVRDFRTELGNVRDTLKKHDVALLMSTFVTKYRRSQPREVQIANADVAFYYMPWLSIDTLMTAMDLYNQTIVDFANENGIPVIVETDSIPTDDTCFADCMHLRDAGCEAMAKRFATFIIENDLLRQVEKRTRSTSSSSPVGKASNRQFIGRSTGLSSVIRD
jgi:hypothetical protein